jgi:CHAT domain-containing protein/tetratricopeptide (TPR) repeat protein
LLDAACPKSGDGGIELDDDEAAAKARRRLGGVFRSAGDGFGGDGRHELAFRAYLCALRAVLPDNAETTKALSVAQRAILSAIASLLGRWEGDDAPDFRKLRGLLGTDAELVRLYARRRAELAGERACVAEYVAQGKLTDCLVPGEPEGSAPRTAGALGAGARYGAGETSSAIMTSSRPNLGLDPPSDATGDAVLALAPGYERRWGDGSPLEVTGRWIFGLARLEKGDLAGAARSMPDAEASAHEQDGYMGQLLLVRSRARRDRGDLEGALADSTRARASSGIEDLSAVEHAENLRAAGRLREAEVLLEAWPYNAICTRAPALREPEERARQIQEWADGLALRDGVTASLAPLSDALRHCGPFDASAALHAVDDAQKRCSATHEAGCDDLPAFRSALAVAAPTLRAPDLATCDRMQAALSKLELFEGEGIRSSIKNDLGVTYYAEGRYEDALRSFRDAECFASPWQVLRAIGNAAGASFTMGNVEQAQSELARAMGLARRGIAPAREMVALLANEGKVKLARADLAGAQASFAAALRELDRAGLPDHELRAQVMDDVGVGLDLAGKRDAAEQSYEAALALHAEADARSPGVATSLGHLATLHWAEGDPKKGLPLLQRMQSIEEETLVRLLAFGSEESKRAAVAKVAESADWLVSLDLGALRDDGAATALALTSVVSRQGRALDAAARTQGALFAHAGGDVRGLLERLRVVEERIVWLTLQAPRARTPDERRDEAAELRMRHEEEQQLGDVLRGKLGALDREAVLGLEGGLASLERALRPGQALVVYATYRPFHPERATSRFDEPRYAAYVIGQGGAIGHADLGPAARVDALVARFREALSSQGPVAGPGGELAALVFAPLAKMIGDAKDLYLVPDAALNLVPFDALEQESVPLANAYRFTMLTSARDIATLGGRRPGGRGVLVMANPDFGDAAAAPSAPARGAGGLLAGARFTPLPGTAAEAKGIARAFPEAKLVLGKDATGKELLAARSPEILHVATHGFFLGAPAHAAKAARGLVLDDAAGALLAPPSADVPALLRSGLAFAGANRRDEGSLVAALDLAQVDLRGTRLVTLSACESGVGETAPGDGVYGVRRALYLAGSETQVLSLWKVDDEATAMLMTSFYTELRKGRSRGEALRRAKAGVARTARFAHPYYWAAFMLNGSPDKLDGSPAEPVEPLGNGAGGRCGGMPCTNPPHACGCRAVGGGPADAPLPVGFVVVFAGLAGVARACGRASSAKHERGAVAKLFAGSCERAGEEAEVGWEDVVAVRVPREDERAVDDVLG